MLKRLAPKPPRPRALNHRRRKTSPSLDFKITVEEHLQRRSSSVAMSEDEFRTLQQPTKSNESFAATDIEGIPTTAPIMQTFATQAHKRKSIILSQIERSTFCSSREAETSESSCMVATESMEMETKKEDDLNPLFLLTEIRSLPCSMSEKREFRRELLLAAKIIEHQESRHFDTYYQRIKMRISHFFSESVGHFEWGLTSLKAIEGKFGTGVVSYFVFLRWLIRLNLFIFFLLFIYVVIPQTTFSISDNTLVVTSVPHNVATDNATKAGHNATTVGHYTEVQTRAPLLFPGLLGLQSPRDPKDLGSLLNQYATEGLIDATLRSTDSNMTSSDIVTLAQVCAAKYASELKNLTSHGGLAIIQDFFQGTGWLEDSILFMGYYLPSDVSIGNLQYGIPLAFLVVLFVLVFLNLILMMMYASKGVQEMMLKSFQEQYCYLLFCGWDFSIRSNKTAMKQHNNAFYELKSYLSEARRKLEVSKWTHKYKMQLYAIRVAMYFVTILMVLGCYFILYYVVEFQINVERTSHQEGFRSMMIKYLPSLTLTTINAFIPFTMSFLVLLEKYDIQLEINVLLLRVVFIRLSSIIIIAGSFYHQIICEPQDQCGRGLEKCPSPMCWETYVGQQLYRLVFLDLFVHIGVILFWETPRRLVQKRWPVTKNFTGYRLFDIPTQVLSLVYSQTLCWLGMFFSPLLPLVSLLKLIILFYIKKYSLMVNCLPHKVPFKASRSNAIFVVVLMLSFFITIAILGYAVMHIAPSVACGPFRHNTRNMVHSVYIDMQLRTPKLAEIIPFLFSPIIQIPLIIILCLILYYYLTKTSAHKNMVKLLKVQLIMEAKDKHFLLGRVTRLQGKMPTIQERAVFSTPSKSSKKAI